MTPAYQKTQKETVTNSLSNHLFYTTVFKNYFSPTKILEWSQLYQPTLADQLLAKIRQRKIDKAITTVKERESDANVSRQKL